MLTVRAPEGDQPQTVEAIHALGDHWWPLQMARELDDAILMLRTNELDLGLLLIKTTGRPGCGAGFGCGDAATSRAIGWCARPSACCGARSRGWMFLRAAMYAISIPDSCFAGLLFELALAADRSYMLACRKKMRIAPKIAARWN